MRKSLAVVAVLLVLPGCGKEAASTATTSSTTAPTAAGTSSAPTSSAGATSAAPSPTEHTHTTPPPIYPSTPSSSAATTTAPSATESTTSPTTREVTPNVLLIGPRTTIRNLDGKRIPDDAQEAAQFVEDAVGYAPTVTTAGETTRLRTATLLIDLDSDGDVVAWQAFPGPSGESEGKPDIGALGSSYADALDEKPTFRLRRWQLSSRSDSVTCTRPELSNPSVFCYNEGAAVPPGDHSPADEATLVYAGWGDGLRVP